MKTLAFVLLATLTVSSSWATEYSGKCAKQAEEAAITKWADVPNPDPGLEYITISSKATAARGSVYSVLLALSDGNEEGRAGYTVTFGSLTNCSDPVVTDAQ